MGRREAIHQRPARRDPAVETVPQRSDGRIVIDLRHLEVVHHRSDGLPIKVQRLEVVQSASDRARRRELAYRVREWTEL
jgi:hypothetical protein